MTFGTGSTGLEGSDANGCAHRDCFCYFAEIDLRSLAPKARCSASDSQGKIQKLVLFVLSPFNFHFILRGSPVIHESMTERRVQPGGHTDGAQDDDLGFHAGEQFAVVGAALILLQVLPHVPGNVQSSVRVQLVQICTHHKM